MAPWPDNRAISRDLVAITLNPSAGLIAPATTAADDLPHRVADHRVGFHPVGTPQLRQRQLDTDEHRLDAVDTDDRFTGFEHLPQRKSGLLNKSRLQLVDGGSKSRLVGKQLPAHPRPLRSLPGVDEHRSPNRATRYAAPRRPVPGGRQPGPAARSRLGQGSRSGHGGVRWRAAFDGG